MHLNLALLLSATVLGIAAPAQNAELNMDTTDSESIEHISHSCPLCFKSYTRRHNLKTHFRARHQAQEMNYPDLFRTLKSTKTNKLFPCPIPSCICGFTRKGDLKLHFCRKHADKADIYPDIVKGRSSKVNKPFACPFKRCPCGYKRKGDLKSHLQLKHNTVLNQDDETYEDTSTSMSLDDNEELDMAASIILHMYDRAHQLGASKAPKTI